jgi:hypothetical protein
MRRWRSLNRNPGAMRHAANTIIPTLNSTVEPSLIFARFPVQWRVAAFVNLFSRGRQRPLQRR